MINAIVIGMMFILLFLFGIALLGFLVWAWYVWTLTQEAKEFVKRLSERKSL